MQQIVVNDRKSAVINFKFGLIVPEAHDVIKISQDNEIVYVVLVVKHDEFNIEFFH